MIARQYSLRGISRSELPNSFQPLVNAVKRSCSLLLAAAHEQLAHSKQVAGSMSRQVK